MKPIQAICYPGTTFSPSLIRSASIYFDKILLLNPNTNVEEVRNEINEINGTINSINKNYLIKVVRDNIPYLMTFSTNPDPDVILSGFGFSFILTGVSTYKYLTDKNYSLLKKRLEVLNDQHYIADEIEVLLNYSIIESIPQTVETNISSVTVNTVLDDVDLNRFSLIRVANEFYKQTKVENPYSVSLTDSIIILKKHIALLLEAYRRNAVIVTDNPAVHKFLNLITLSIIAEEHVSPITLNRYLSDTLIKGSLGLNYVNKKFPDLDKLKIDEILELRYKNERSLKELRRCITSISERYFEGISIEEQKSAISVIENELDNELRELDWEYKEGTIKYPQDAVMGILTMNPISAVDTSLEYLIKLKKYRNQDLDFVRGVKSL